MTIDFVAYMERNAVNTENRKTKTKLNNGIHKRLTKFTYPDCMDLLRESSSIAFEIIAK